ncbi:MULTISPECIES: hypothetical protein [unclassified Sphingomonas]|uniref:hypothetical protein n=1 Tax=unclassified Sphingomonas TaxID=196159 RepID=UPI0022B4336D|nr:hypothetical protein [Sphingomonas sp. NIBR02145]WHU04341.1 hypothetical protein O3305_07060 [Sphingomonas sp. NIBR02145]
MIEPKSHQFGHQVIRFIATALLHAHELPDCLEARISEGRGWVPSGHHHANSSEPSAQRAGRRWRRTIQLGRIAQRYRHGHPFRVIEIQ